MSDPHENLPETAAAVTTGALTWAAFVEEQPDFATRAEAALRTDIHLVMATLRRTAAPG